MNKNVGYQWLVRMVNDILDGKNQGKIDSKITQRMV